MLLLVWVYVGEILTATLQSFFSPKSPGVAPRFLTIENCEIINANNNNKQLLILIEHEYSVMARDSEKSDTSSMNNNGK